MKALVLSAYKHLELEDVPVPQPAEDELLIRIKACGICGSDVHGFDGSTGRRIPPIVMGHEAAGIVEAVGAGVANFHVGDRVTFDSTVYCGRVLLLPAGTNQSLRRARSDWGFDAAVSQDGRVCGVCDGAGADRLSVTGVHAVFTCSAN